MCVYTLAGSGSGGVGSSKYCSHQTGRSVCRGPLECSWLRPRLPYPSCPSEHRQAYVMMSGWAFAICFCTDLQEGLVTGHSTELEVTKGSLQSCRLTGVELSSQVVSEPQFSNFSWQSYRHRSRAWCMGLCCWWVLPPLILDCHHLLVIDIVKVFHSRTWSLFLAFYLCSHNDDFIMMKMLFIFWFIILPCSCFTSSGIARPKTENWERKCSV